MEMRQQCTLPSSLQENLNVFFFSLILLHEQKFDREILRSQVENMGSNERRSLRKQGFSRAYKKWIQCDSLRLLSGMTISDTFWAFHARHVQLLGRRSCDFIISSVSRTTLSHVSYSLLWIIKVRIISHVFCPPPNWCNIWHIPISEEITVRKLENSVFVLYDTKH